MPQLIIENLHQLTISYEDKSDLILDVLLRHTDWMHACGGKGRCTTCKMIVCSGGDQLSEPSILEIQFRTQHRLEKNERLACQTRNKGSLSIRVAKIYQLPHIDYSS